MAEGMVNDRRPPEFAEPADSGGRKQLGPVWAILHIEERRYG